MDDALIQLVVSAKAGERGALRALFSASHRWIMPICMVSSDNQREVAKELTQEVFLSAFGSLAKLKEPAAYRSWLYRIAINTCHKHKAWAARERQMLTALMLEQDVQIDRDDKAWRAARDQIIREVLESIHDDKTRKIALMKYTDPEHTSRQIAAELGIPHGTVTVTLMRLREKIRPILLRALRGDA